VIPNHHINPKHFHYIFLYFQIPYNSYI
jgi:hypothetical protein